MGLAVLSRDEADGAGPLRQLMRTVRPTGREHRFGDDELIVSKTDLRGVITYANPVFLRLAGLGEPDALGAPHSLIRHPDMPRCVFQLLWERIQSGREIFAYVVNLSADGGHYWVLAHVTPSFGRDGQIVGYHSNRRSPERRALNVIEPLYGRLRSLEDSHREKAAGTAASRRALDEALAEKGVDYDRFVFDL